MTCSISRSRLLSLLRSADEKVVNSYWVKCDFCSGFMVFENERDRGEWMRGHGAYCYHCGCRISFGTKEGRFPRGKVLIWDEEEV